MTQLFSNAVDTTLSATLLIAGTSATLADGSGLQSPTGGDHELLVLSAAGNIEIVRITARAGNVVTITRAQEGTVAREWAIGTRAFVGATAATLSPIPTALQNETAQPFSLALGGAGTVGQEGSVVIGYEATAGTTSPTANANGVAVGRAAEAPREWTVAVGWRAKAQSYSAVAMGNLANANAIAAIALGEQAYAHGSFALGAGWGVEAEGAYSVALGTSSWAWGSQSVALGYLAYVGAPNCFVLSALPVATASTGAASIAAWRNATTGAVVTSGVLDFKTAQTYEIPIPADATFFPDEVGIVITSANTVTVQPTVQFGITGSTQEYLDAVATTGLDAVGKRQRFATLKTAAGAKTLRFEVTVGATATALSGRIYWRGFAIEDPS